MMQACCSETPPPPPPPADAEVVRNIEVLAAFVAKTGPQFEQLARANTAGDPKFGFLLEDSPPGSDTARAHDFYKWKKRRLEQRIFASDGSDDLQLKICAMVEDGFAHSKPLVTPPLLSDTHVIDDTKVLPSGACEKKKFEKKHVGERKAEISHNDDSIRKAGRLPNRRERDDIKLPASTGPQKKKLESINLGKNGVSLGEGSTERLHQPFTGARDDAKQPSLMAETKKATSPVVGALQDDPNRRSAQLKGDPPPPLVIGDAQKKNPTVFESAHKAGISKADQKNSPGGPARTTGDMMEAETEKHGKEAAYGLRLLKAALADYVKEALKPTWKEGNMSKEAFKSIVKKVVDKVIGSIQTHQIPKSQENVDQYMAQSQDKIAKLVQGYVDKFKKN